MPVTQAASFPALPDATREAARELQDFVTPLDIRISHVIYVTRFMTTAEGDWNGRPVIVKLSTREESTRAGRCPVCTWSDRHEMAAYQAFRIAPPAVPVPELAYTDNHRLLVLQRLDDPTMEQAFTDRAPTDGEIDGLLATIRAFNRWQPPTSDFAIDPLHTGHHLRAADRVLSGDDRGRLQDVLDQWGDRFQIAHGDVRSRNVMVSRDGRFSLIDFEFTYRHLPGRDLASLYVSEILDSTPENGGDRAAHFYRKINELVFEEGVNEPFVACLVMRFASILYGRKPSDELLNSFRGGLLLAAWEDSLRRLRAIGG